MNLDTLEPPFTPTHFFGGIFRNIAMLGVVIYVMECVEFEFAQIKFISVRVFFRKCFLNYKIVLMVKTFFYKLDITFFEKISHDNIHRRQNPFRGCCYFEKNQNRDFDYFT